MVINSRRKGLKSPFISLSKKETYVAAYEHDYQEKRTQHFDIDLDLAMRHETPIFTRHHSDPSPHYTRERSESSELSS
jgi:hypothetical protein